MDVGTGDAAGGAREADLCAFLQVLAEFCINFGQVHVDGEDFLPVIDDDAVALVEEFAGEDDGAGVGGENRGSFLDGVVGAAVGAGLLFVQEAAFAKAGGGGTSTGLRKLPDHSGLGERRAKARVLSAWSAAICFF